MASTATGCLAEERSADVIIQIAKPVLQQKKLYLVTKRVFDIVCSFFGLLILAIPMMIIALIITIDSPGAPIFRQERLGLNGKPFMIYKFRTMRLDAEANGPRWADEQDPRCTHFGRILRRTRLDELPQLYNILRGDMSFVGPRPERAYFYRAIITTLNIAQKLLPFFSVPAYYGRFLGLFVLFAISWRTFLAHEGQKLRLFRLRVLLRQHFRNPREDKSCLLLVE